MTTHDCRTAHFCGISATLPVPGREATDMLLKRRHKALPVDNFNARGPMIHERLTDSLVRFVEPILRRPAHLQAAALCVRQKGKRREVLLITSRGTGRWVLPKGWPMKGKTLAEAAAQEAWEEAGVHGAVGTEPVGSYSARKITDTGLGLRCTVFVFSLDVVSLDKDFPESTQRRRKWVTLSRAAKMVQEPELKALLRTL